MVDYLKELKQSWALYLNNLVILLPFVLSTIGLLIVLLFAGLEFLLITFLATGTSLVFENFVFSPLVIGLIIIFCVIDFFLLILLNSYFESMIIAMYKEICLKRKTSMASLFPSGRKYMFVLFKIKLLKFFILYLLPFLVLSIFPLLAFVSRKFILGIVLSLIFGLIFILYSFFLTLGFFFLQPIITTEKNRSAYHLIKKSFNYFFQYPVIVFATLCISVALSIVVTMVLLPIMIMERIIGIVFPPILIITVPIRVIVQVFLLYFVGLYKFKIFFSANNIKKYYENI